MRSGTIRPARSVAALAGAPPAVAKVPDLSEVERLADAGELPRALDLCRRHINGVPGSSQGYYLLGVIEAALGHDDASDAALRRAIYLDPGHVAALQYLASERRRRGDANEAAQLERRATIVRARQP